MRRQACCLPAQVHPCAPSSHLRSQCKSTIPVRHRLLLLLVLLLVLPLVLPLSWVLDVFFHGASCPSPSTMSEWTATWAAGGCTEAHNEEKRP